MLLFDVNIYVYAFREDTPHHIEAKNLLEKALSGDSITGYSHNALAGFLRIATHPRIFNPPAEVGSALEFCRGVIDAPGSAAINPGNSHWHIFTHLVGVSGAKGNLIPDAWFAALAVEHGCRWVTTDRDYTRFSGLEVEFPFGGE